VSDSTFWTQEEAVGFCRMAEALAQDCGCHVALTGGALYKEGPRKDCDLIFYRIRQVDQVDVEKLLRMLTVVGVKVGKVYGNWLIKATYMGRSLDFMFPEGNGHPPMENGGSEAGGY